MFTKAEEALIQELREQKAPLERWAKFFPQHKIVDLMEKPKPLYYLYGKPVYASGYVVGEAPSASYVMNPCAELPCNPEAYARSKKKGNIYMWDDMQDAYLAHLADGAYTTEEIIDRIKRRFGIERTSGAIHSRLGTLGYIKR